jgi:hypothetical protein
MDSPLSDEDINREIVGSLKTFLLDTWEILESELYDRLAFPGREIICDFGAGAQGIAFMAEDGSFVKVTESASEAAFAALLKDRPLQDFPDIQEVYSFRLGNTSLFAIYRESVDDYLEPSEATTLETAVQEVLEGVLEANQPSPESLARLFELSPRHHGEITGFLASLDELYEKTGLAVFDLHLENIGRTGDGRIVVRDFGMNTLTPRETMVFVRNIQALPELHLAMAA